MRADKWNDKGYFESQPVYRLNDEILSVAGSNWRDWRPLNVGWYTSPRFNEFRNRAAEVIASEYDNGSLIYLKDPRICRLLPFWRDVLERAGYRIYCVHIHRNAIDVAASLHSRNGIEQGIATLTWLRHVLDAEYYSRNLPRFFTSYVNILNDWPQFVSRAENAFGFFLRTLSQVATTDIENLIDPGLQHHNAKVRAPLTTAITPDPVQEVLRTLDRWADEGETEEDRSALDAIRVQFDRCTPLFSEPLRALEQAQVSSAKLSEAETHKAELQKQIESTTAKLATLTEEANTTVARLTEKDKIIADLHTNQAKIIAENKRQLQNLEIELARASARQKDLRQQVDTLGAVKEQARKQAAVLSTKLSEAHKKNEQLRERHARELEEMKQAYTSSTSWRISAPMRAFVTLFRRRT
jgi:hypothetical protein